MGGGSVGFYHLGPDGGGRSAGLALEKDKGAVCLFNFSCLPSPITSSRSFSRLICSYFFIFRRLIRNSFALRLRTELVESEHFAPFGQNFGDLGTSAVPSVGDPDAQTSCPAGILFSLCSEAVASLYPTQAAARGFLSPQRHCVWGKEQLERLAGFAPFPALCTTLPQRTPGP